MRSYKNKSKDNDELRRKREEEGIQLRKQKRDEQVFKRRNVQASLAEEDESLFGDVNMSQNAMKTEPDMTITQEMVQNLRHGNYALKYIAVQRIRKMVSIEPCPLIDEVIEAGFVPDLVNLLSMFDQPALQFEAAWALTNIASGNALQTRAVIEVKAVPLFIQLLQSSCADVADQAVWALGNIAGDGYRGRDYVINCGIVQPLVELANNPDTRPPMLKNVVWAMSNVCRGKKPPPDFNKITPCIPVLAKMIFSLDPCILADCCWAISYLSDGPNEHIQAVINSGVSRRLVELLHHESHAVVSSALRAVGNIVTGNDIQTQTILNNSVLPALQHLLSINKDSIRKETCWTISNITAGNRQQIQQVIDSNIFIKLIEIMSTADFKTRKEGAWAITNATSGGSGQQIKYLVQRGCIQPMCGLLSSLDTRVIMVALNGLENILREGKRDQTETGVNQYALMTEECGGLDSIESLQAHDNQDIYQKVYDIIDHYFSTEDEDVTIMPDVDTDAKQFTFNSNTMNPEQKFKF